MAQRGNPEWRTCADLEGGCRASCLHEGEEGLGASTTQASRRTMAPRCPERRPRPESVRFADLHLDTSFAWAGATSSVARQRRQGLRNALLRIVALVREVQADALFCGGDLYEDQRVTPDTAEFLRATFAGLDPTPVFLAPGNHDWYGPESVYALTAWSPNVHVFREPRLVPVSLRPGVTLWDGAHCAPANTDNFLAGFGVRGAPDSANRAAARNRTPPSTPAEIGAAGLLHAFVGHYHRPKDAERHTYPGNPDPLAFGEDGPRGAVIATIEEHGVVARERRAVAQTEVHDLELDVSGCASGQEIRDRVRALAEGRGGMARVTVTGELEPDVNLREDDLRDALLETFGAVRVRLGALHAGYDVATIRDENTVRVAFVNDVLESGLPEAVQRRVLVAGLRALDGRRDLDVL